MYVHAAHGMKAKAKAKEETPMSSTATTRSNDRQQPRTAKEVIAANVQSLAEAATVPVGIREMTDAQVLEAQLIELSVVVKRFLSAIAALHVVNIYTTRRCPAHNGHYSKSKPSHARRTQSADDASCPRTPADPTRRVEDRLEECIALKSSIQMVRPSCCGRHWRLWKQNWIGKSLCEFTDPPLYGSIA
jgi:hypothetical protein